MGMLTDACPSCGCYPEAADMLDAHVRYIVRERDEARADAARWKAEAERLREALGLIAAQEEAHALTGQHLLAISTARAALSAGGGTDA